MKRTLWTCDKCGYGETTTEVFAPATRDFYSMIVTVKKQPHGLASKPTAEALWCAECAAEMKVLPVFQPSAGEKAPAPPTIDDLVYEIASNAASDAQDNR